jgi:RNA polymerase sigma factor (sigma-70 family)
LTGARPQAIGALLRYFRDMDRAEEAFQEACLRALKSWPQNGPPRDPTAWLILVGRNAALDGVRKQSRHAELPPDEHISDLEDAETPLAERLDSSQYRDDVLRLLFVCCHPDLPATQQIALALRIVSGLTVPQIARAFLVSEGLALIDKAMRHNRPGPYQVQAAIAAVHARAATADRTDWANIDHLYAALERMQPSPVVTLNRAVAVGKVQGPEAALEMIAPLEERLSGYFHFFGARGAFLLQLGRNDEARRDFDRAIALAGTPAEAAHIRRHLDRLMVG